MPFHSSLTFDKYGFGLGCNTMEGREQKHQRIEKYMRQSTWHNRWEMAFQHEYVSLIYLRSNGFDELKYKKHGVKYIPETPAKSCDICKELVTGDRCELCDNPARVKSCSVCKGLVLNGKCDLCDHQLMQLIKEELSTKYKQPSTSNAQKKPASKKPRTSATSKK